MFRYFLLLLSFSFILLSSVKAQVTIKEKVEIKPTNTTLKKGNSNSITATSYNIRFEMDWDKPNREALLTLIYPEGYDSTNTGWQTGGSLSIKLNADRAGISFLFQVRVNLYDYEKSNVTYRIYFNGELVDSSSFVLVGDLISIPYRNIGFFPPVANNFNFYLVNKNSDCNNNFEDLFLSPIYDTTDNVWRTDKQIHFSITSGGEFIHFAEYSTNTVVGNSLDIIYPYLSNYYLFVDDSVTSTINNAIKITATTNTGFTREINTGIATYITGALSKEFNIIKNEKINISAWEATSFCSDIKKLTEGTTFSAETIQGSEYGELINPQNNTSGNNLTGIIPENDKINIKFYANGNEALTNEEIKVRISNSLENVQPLELSFTVVPAEVDVNFEPEELAPGDTASIIIQHRKTDGTLEPFPSDQDYEVQLIEGSNYGTILSSNGVDTSDYFGTVTDGIKFIADSNINVSNADVRLKVTTIYFGGYKAEKGGGIERYKNHPQKFAEENKLKTNKQAAALSKSKAVIKGGKNVNGITFIDPIYGIGKAVIKQGDIELKILEPDTVTVDTYISPTPVMPNLTVKAQLKNYNKGAFTFNWKYSISWTNSKEPRTISKTFEGAENGTNSSISSWNIPWESSFIGGDNDTLTITANTGSKTYKKVIANPFRILGKNPTIAAVKNELTLYQQVIAYQESSPKWKQFNATGFPVWGYPSGYGIMQIDTPPATDNQIWNWRDNIDGGKVLLEEKYNWGKSYPSRLRKRAGHDRPLCFKNITDFTTDEQIWKEAFQLYNGGHNWRWKLDGPKTDPNTGGHWVQILVNKKGDKVVYGRNSWNLYQDVKNGNSPQGWN